MLECKCKSTGHNIDTEQEATATNRNRKRSQERGSGNRQVRRIDQIRYPMTEVASLSAVPQSCRTPLQCGISVRAPGRFTHTHTHTCMCGLDVPKPWTKKEDLQSGPCSLGLLGNSSRELGKYRMNNSSLQLIWPRLHSRGVPPKDIFGRTPQT